MSCHTRYSGLFWGLILVFGLSTSWLEAQSVLIGTDNVGATYTIGPQSPFTSEITFAAAGGTVNASSNYAWTGKIHLDSDGTFNVTSTNNNPAMLTLNGEIDGIGTLTKKGEGTLVVKDALDFHGVWQINEGTVKLDATNGKLSGSSGVILDAKGTLDLNGTSQTLAFLEGEGKIENFNGTLTIEDDWDAEFSGKFEGTDIATELVKKGGGTLILSGDNAGTFTGKLSVLKGTLMVNADYSGSDVTTVDTGATLGGKGKLKDVTIESGGTLAPGDRYGDVGSELKMGNLTMDPDSTLNLRFDDATNVDAINATKGVIDSGAKVVFEAAAGDYSADVEIDADDFFTATGPNSLSFTDFSGDLSSTNISFAQKGFLDFEIDKQDKTKFTVTRNSTYFTDEAANQGATYNQRQVAAALDRTNSAGMWDLLTQLNDAGDIRGALDQLSGAVKANSMMLGQWRTSRYGLNHLDLTPCGEQSDYGLWLEIVHQTTDFDDDGNSADYGISRTGFLLGSEERRGDTVFGALVGYSEPYLYGNNNKIETKDLQFGFYGGSKLSDFFETKLFIGVGNQKYRSRRSISDPVLIGADSPYRIHSSYKGNSMSMSLELAMPLGAGLFCFRPVVAVDSDLTWQYGHTEKGTTGHELSYDRAFYDRTFIRTGVTTQLGSVEECSMFTLLGRAFYEYQIVGDAAPMSKTRFAHDASNAYRMEVLGVDPGKSFVDLGVGFRWNLDDSRSFYGDYDYHFSTRSDGHYGSIGYMQRW